MVPKESAWFSQLVFDGATVALQPLHMTSLYSNDVIRSAASTLLVRSSDARLDIIVA